MCRVIYLPGWYNIEGAIVGVEVSSQPPCGGWGTGAGVLRDIIEQMATGTIEIFLQTNDKG